MKSIILVTKADSTQHAVGPFETGILAHDHIVDGLSLGVWPQSFGLEVLDLVLDTDA